MTICACIRPQKKMKQKVQGRKKTNVQAADSGTCVPLMRDSGHGQALSPGPSTPFNTKANASALVTDQYCSTGFLEHVTQTLNSTFKEAS